MAHLIFSHGDKGGVGKSVVSAAIVDYCLANGHPVGLVEGDKSQPDVALRFQKRVEIEAVNLQRSDSKQKAGMQLVDEAVGNLTKNSDQNTIVVINLPASAGGTLDEIAETIVSAAQMYGHTCSVVYCLGQLHPATDGIRHSIQSGLIGAMKPNVTVAYNRYLGDPARWDYVTSGTRKKLGTKFHEIEIPELNDELANKIFSTRRPFHELIQPDCGDLAVMEKMIFRDHWLNDMQKAVASLMPAKSSEGASDG